MLYCLKCKKLANKKHKCDISDLISVTKNMIPVANIIDNSLGLQVASAFFLADTHNHTLVEAGVYFKRIYPEVLLQDLPSGWYWTDYITIDNKAICSCLSYEAEYVDTGAMSLVQTIESVINDLLGYLATRDKDALQAILTLIES